MLLGALGKYTRQQCMGTNHCPGGGNRPVLFNKVPYTAALSIEQEAPVPKHKCDDIQRQNKNCKWQSKRQISETYSVIYVSVLCKFWVPRSKNMKTLLLTESLNIITISMLWFQQQMWMQQLCTASHVLLLHCFLGQTTEVLKYIWRLGVPVIYKPSHTILSR